MRKMTARLLWAVCIVGTITGGYAKGKTMQAARAMEEEVMEQTTSYDRFGSMKTSVEIIPGSSDELWESRGEAEEIPETSAGEKVPDASSEAGQPGKEEQREEQKLSASESSAAGTETAKETVSAPGDADAGSDERGSRADSGREGRTPFNTACENTVNYVPSRKEEKTETVYVRSVVDEKDPDTYQTVIKEVPVPCKYVNRAGELRYEYRDGIWYEYIYSSGDIILDEPGEKLALRLLNLDGSYNGYEILEVKCTEAPGDDGSMQYGYHVRYRRTLKWNQKPAELEYLLNGGMMTVSDKMMVEVEEKVPVLTEKEVLTGDYDYYGWQTLEGNTCYFDEEGEKVTGTQVIQGIRHEFDENGTKISRTGVDVSEENGNIDWTGVRGAGVDSAWIRCAYRTAEEEILRADSRAEENIEAAKAAGIETGIFVSSRVTTKKDAMEAADFAVLMAERHGLTGYIALMIPEEDPQHAPEGTFPDSQTAFVNAFCRIVRMSGFVPVVCADEDWLSKNLKTEELDGCLFWISQYDTKITYTGPYEWWRYTDSGSVNGISGYTGLTISHGELGGTSK